MKSQSVCKKMHGKSMYDTSSSLEGAVSEKAKRVAVQFEHSKYPMTSPLDPDDSTSSRNMRNRI